MKEIVLWRMKWKIWWLWWEFQNERVNVIENSENQWTVWGGFVEIFCFFVRDETTNGWDFECSSPFDLQRFIRFSQFNIIDKSRHEFSSTAISSFTCIVDKGKAFRIFSNLNSLICITSFLLNLIDCISFLNFLLWRIHTQPWFAFFLFKIQTCCDEIHKLGCAIKVRPLTVQELEQIIFHGIQIVTHAKSLIVEVQGSNGMKEVFGFQHSLCNFSRSLKFKKSVFLAKLSNLFFFDYIMIFIAVSCSCLYLGKASFQYCFMLQSFDWIWKKSLFFVQHFSDFK